MLACGFDLHAIHSSLRPKNVYKAVAACCVASLDIKFGKMYPRAVEITCMREMHHGVHLQEIRRNHTVQAASTTYCHGNQCTHGTNVDNCPGMPHCHNGCNDEGFIAQFCHKYLQCGYENFTCSWLVTLAWCHCQHATRQLCNIPSARTSGTPEVHSDCCP